jgi:phosphomevalonate kinase
MSIKNPQNVKRQLDDVDNMIMILQDNIRRGLKIDPQEAQRRFKVIREKLKYAHDSIQG